MSLGRIQYKHQSKEKLDSNQILKFTLIKTPWDVNTFIVKAIVSQAILNVLELTSSDTLSLHFIDTSGIYINHLNLEIVEKDVYDYDLVATYICNSNISNIYSLKVLLNGIAVLSIPNITENIDYYISNIGTKFFPNYVCSQFPRSITPSLLPKLFFLSGTAKSGTTWLENIINQNSDAIVLHESNLLNFVTSYDTNLFSGKHDYIKWHLTKSKDQFSISYINYSIFQNISLFYADLMNVKFVGDRTPNSISFLSKLLDDYNDLDIRVVHIVRHPFDVLISTFFHDMNVLKSRDKSDVELTDILNIIDCKSTTLIPEHQLFYCSKILYNWKADQDLILDTLKRHPKKILIVKYEDLHTNPRSEILNIYRHLGFDYSVRTLEDVVSVTDFSRYTSGRAKGEEDSKSFFRKGVVGDYVNYLNKHTYDYLFDEISSTSTVFGYQK